MEVFLPQRLPQKPVLALLCLSLLAKEGMQTGNPCTWMQIKQLSAGPVDVPEEVPEDIQLMRGSCGSERQSRSLTHFKGVYSRVTMLISSEDRFCKRPKDMSIEVEER